MRDTLLLACVTRESRTAMRLIFEDKYNLLEYLRHEPGFADIPLLVVLGEDGPIDEATAFSMGASDVITLPCDPPGHPDPCPDHRGAQSPPVASAGTAGGTGRHSPALQRCDGRCPILHH